ncbi:MAG: hypothetical protein M1541_03485 [Acidobacteria bacterium]|nr:hypothetical protein [Acidobacteriota bacterium]
MIATKGEFNALSRAGHLGNFLRSWDTPELVAEAEYRGFLTIRSRVPSSRWFVPVVHYSDLRNTLDVLAWRGGPSAAGFYFQEIPDPNTRRIANIEAMLTERGVFLYFERDTTSPVRGIRERGACLNGGLRAQAVLRTLLSPDSYDTLHEIWSQHPTSIIEATEWAAPCGAFHQPLTVWEVRDF